MPYKSEKNKIYKIKNRDGMFWTAGSYKWTKTGSVWRSLDGLKAHIRWVGDSTSYYRNRFNKKENRPVIVELAVTEVRVLTLEGKEFPKPEPIEEVGTENLEDI